MSHGQFYALAVAIPLVQLMVLMWVLVRQRGIGLVLVVNILFAGMVLFFVAPKLPQELRAALAWGSSDWVDYKVTMWSSFELVTLGVSAFAFGGFPPARIIAWIGFAGNFALSVGAMLLILKFAIT